MIITIEDLIEYLKIPDFKATMANEVEIRKITHEGISDFETVSKEVLNNYRELTIDPEMYIDSSGQAYYKHFDNQEVYTPILYTGSNQFIHKDYLPLPVVKVVISEEIYNNVAYSFYINQQNNIIASIQYATTSNISNYINYNANEFNYLRRFSSLPFRYTNVRGNTSLDNIIVHSYTNSDTVHRFPILHKEFGGYYTLSYFYKKHDNQVRNLPPTEDDKKYIAIQIRFKYLTSILSFLNKTIFSDFNEYNDFLSHWRYRFLESVTHYTLIYYNSSDNSNNKFSVIYHVATPMYFAIDKNSKYGTSLWEILKELAKGNITNAWGINEEDLIIKLLQIIYHKLNHRLKQFFIEKQVAFDKVVKEERKEEKYIGSVENNTFFINKLLNEKVSNEILLYRLIKGLDGDQFKRFVYFVWSIWKVSYYNVLDPKVVKAIEDAVKHKKNTNGKTSQITDIKQAVIPTILDYRSGKILGFHADNASVNWEGKAPNINVVVNTKVGTKEVPKITNIGEEKPRYRETGATKIIDFYEKIPHNYHPFAPVVLINSDNPKFILKDDDNSNQLFTVLPAFILYANKEAAYWENIITGGEYLIDIITTISGVGNILKAGRLFKILKNGRTLVFRTKNVTKAIGVAKAAAGAIEVTSGTVNALLKLTGANDTELGRSISKYLFYLEMAALTGEITVALRSKLQKTAREIIDNPKFEKSLDDLAKKGEVDERLKTRIIGEIKLASAEKSLSDIDLDISQFIIKIAEILPKKADNTLKAIKKAEQDIHKLVGLIKDPEKQLEYAFLYNPKKGFKNLKPFTSQRTDSVIIADSFGKGEKLTKQRIKSLKGSIFTHNHPNFSRFSNDDIKVFLKFQLKELRAINSRGIIYSLKLKPGAKISKKEFITIYRDLEEAKSAFAVERFLKAKGFEETKKIIYELYDFEEEFILNKIKDKIKYTIFK